MNSAIAALILSVCTQAGITDESCPTLLTPDSVRAVAQHAIGKSSGKSYILVNTWEFKQLSEEAQRGTLVHELAHHSYYQDTGKKSLSHSNKWKRGCLALAREAGVAPSVCRVSFAPSRTTK